MDTDEGLATQKTGVRNWLYWLFFWLYYQESVFNSISFSFKPHVLRYLETSYNISKPMKRGGRTHTKIRCSDVMSCDLIKKMFLLHYHTLTLVRHVHECMITSWHLSLCCLHLMSEKQLRDVALRSEMIKWHYLCQCRFSLSKDASLGAKIIVFNRNTTLDHRKCHDLKSQYNFFTGCRKKKQQRTMWW